MKAITKWLEENESYISTKAKGDLNLYPLFEVGDRIEDETILAVNQRISYGCSCSGFDIMYITIEISADIGRKVTKNFIVEIALGQGYGYTVESWETGIINLTPHEINEVISGKSYPPSGEVARVETAHFPQEVDGKPLMVNGAPIYSTIVGNRVTMEKSKADLPRERRGVFLLVSGMVLDAAQKTAFPRKDLLAPGELVRDEKGRPIGCKGFVK